MKRLGIALAFVCGLVVATLAQQQSFATANAPGELTCKQLTITSDDGNCSLVISASETSVGMWMTNKKTKQYAYMYTSPHFSPYFAIGDGKGSDPFAVSVDSNGELSLQCRTKDDRRTVNVYSVPDLIRPSQIRN